MGSNRVCWLMQGPISYLLCHRLCAAIIHHFYEQWPWGMCHWNVFFIFFLWPEKVHIPAVQRALAAGACLGFFNGVALWWHKVWSKLMQKMLLRIELLKNSSLLFFNDSFFVCVVWHSWGSDSEYASAMVTLTCG